MNFENSFEWVTQFWKANQGLVEQLQTTVQGTAADLKKLADAEQQNQQQGNQLAAALGTQFKVASDAQTKQKQLDLLNQIQELNKEIAEFHDEPDITADLLATRSTLYVALADTFDQTVEQFVQFTPEEIIDINGLLKQATLDTASRQKWAAVLDASVALTKMALNVAVKMAAA